MKLRDGIGDSNLLRFDYFGDGEIVIKGLSGENIDKIIGLCSLKNEVSNSLVVKWWDFEGLLKRLKELGYSEAEYESERAKDFIEKVRRYESALESLQSKESEVEVEKIKFNGELYKIQKKGVIGLLLKRVFGLFDEMGVGKTVEAIYAYGLLKEKLGRCKCLIVCPKTVKLEWRNAFRKFLEIEVSLSEEGISTDIVVAHYEELITRNVKGKIFYSKIIEDLLKEKWDVIIIDESHFIKNYRSKRTKAVFSFLKKRKRAVDKFIVGRVDNQEVESGSELPFVWFLTGTPMERAKDVYNFLNMGLDKFLSFTKFQEFFTKFKDAYYYQRKVRVEDGMQNEEELASLLSKISLRRSRSEIVEIDEINRTIEISFSKEQRKEYRKAMNEADSALEKAIRGIQYCNKVKSDIISDFIKGTKDKVVIWTVFRDSVDYIKEVLEKEKFKVLTFKGGDNREDVEDKFINGDYQVIVATIAKGAVGINFMKVASVVIYVEKPYSYTLWKQSRDRVMRVDRDLSKPVLFISLEVENSTDVLLNKVIERKIDLNRLILEGWNDEDDIDENEVGESLNLLKEDNIIP